MKKVSRIIKILFILWFISLSQVSTAESNIKIKSITNNLPLKNTIRRSVYNKLLADSVTLENSYNLKDELSEISPITVKDQKQSGSCWAFSFTSVLETSVAKQLNKKSKIFSPMHLEYVTANMFNRTKGSGAGAQLSVAYAVSGHGPVEEEQMKFEYELRKKYNPDNLFKNKVTKVETIEKSVAVVAYKESVFQKIINKIKDIFHISN